MNKMYVIHTAYVKSLKAIAIAAENYWIMTSCLQVLPCVVL